MNHTIDLDAEEKPVLANGVTLRALSRIKPLLSTWPAILPTPENPALRPMAIGIDKAILALLVEPENEDARRQVKAAIKALVKSPGYWQARDAPGAMRYDIDGNPVEPVAEEHKTHKQPKPKADKPTALKAEKETIVVIVTPKALKVTAVVQPSQLKPAPPGADVVLSVEVIDGMKATARLNPKSYRKALAAIEEHGAENVAVIVQGNMVKSGVIESAGISAQPKKPKA